jgi:hypothetical protein
MLRHPPGAAGNGGGSFRGDVSSSYLERWQIKYGRVLGFVSKAPSL